MEPDSIQENALASFSVTGKKPLARWAAQTSAVARMWNKATWKISMGYKNPEI